MEFLRFCIAGIVSALTPARLAGGQASGLKIIEKQYQSMSMGKKVQIKLEEGGQKDLPLQRACFWPAQR
jgi:hypothetical protein